MFYPRLKLLKLLSLSLQEPLAEYREAPTGKCCPDPCEVLTDQSVLQPHHRVGLTLTGQIPQVEQVVSSPDWTGAGADGGDPLDVADPPDPRHHPAHHSVLRGRSVQQAQHPPDVIAQSGLSLSS